MPQLTRHDVIRQALDAFREGKAIDPQNPDWDKEVTPMVPDGSRVGRERRWAGNILVFFYGVSERLMMARIWGPNESGKRVAVSWFHRGEKYTVIIDDGYDSVWLDGYSR